MAIFNKSSEVEKPQEIDDSKSAAFVQKLLGVGIGGVGPFDGAKKVANAARQRHPDRDSAIDAVVKQHTKLVAAGGFVTGLGGLVTLPVALPSNVAGFYILATRAVAAVAELRGYDTDKPEVRSAVLLTLIGSEASDVLKVAGSPAGGRVASFATSRLSPSVLMLVNKGVGFRLLTKLATSGILRGSTRVVPFLGGVVGAGVDTVMLRKIVKHAKEKLPVV
ncbi:EcsC family protein [Kineococcus gynurae]|uniref:EcsC family protein n=1 Tax=Kineococcus gynurae TaxID=452979 RepID=A0ABV5LV79_9ACTN